eukprot:CAMPEP_0171479082 /NCGR_PEP_ID=MMETSP0946-20130122/5179_1 /TAXON_ID=109269 /ORGANISM="Vaucheria litorea, Strain CCMP2940" /LENGTH=167 /DNA_ID=CAMNT_0012009877 /DNA_START=180 /DNA_END=680 /DNA_ORIENTATION=-
MITAGDKKAAKVLPNFWYLLQFDGGSRGNPGLCGAGVVVYNFHRNVVSLESSKSTADLCRESIFEASIYLNDHSTCNEAEYAGIIYGLEAALKLGVKKLVIEGDSMLVVKQLLGSYKVKAKKLMPLHQRAESLLSKFSDFKIVHIERSLNSKPDLLANRAMDHKKTE